MTASPGRVPRPRLLDRLAAQRVGLIEAGAGFGKSVLAEQYGRSLGIATVYVPLGASDDDAGVLAGSVRRALVQSHLSDLSEATADAEPAAWLERLLDALADRSDPVLLVLDDAHHLHSDGSAALILRLAQALPEPHRLLVAARSFARRLEPLWAMPQPGHLDTAALMFTAAETGALFDLRGVRVDPDEAEHVRAVTDGWATAIVLAAASGGELSGARADDPVAGQLRGLLDGLSPADATLANKLAHLPLLSVSLCDEVAGRAGAFETLVGAGLPLARTAAGWWELPSPVSELLAARAPASPVAVRIATEHYRRDGADVAALRVLMSAELSADAARTLAGLPPARIDELGLGVVRDVVESLPSAAVDAHSRSLIHLARLAETAHLNQLRSDALARARTALEPSTDAALMRELDAELSRDLMWDTRTRAQSRALAQAVVDAADPEELVARARALDVLGRHASWFSPTGPQPEAVPLLRESARLSRRLGQSTWTAQALVALGAGYYFTVCRFELALATLDEALGALPARHRYRTMVQAFRAEILIELGRTTEATAAIEEMNRIGAACGERWMIAYAAWEAATAASYAGDADATRAAVARGMEHRDDWFEQPSGVEFLAQSADYLSRVGLHREAIQQLDRARSRVEAAAHLVLVHGASVLARSGDPEEADRELAAALADPGTEPQERWPLLLHGAWVAHRRGRDDAGALAADAFAACAEVGHPRGPLLREREITRVLLPLAVAAGSVEARELAGEEATGWRLELLGGFRVTRNAAPVVLPAGRPALAVRLLAVLGRMHVERMIELLWPGVAPEVGRNRLRNLLSRVRAVAGDLVTRDGDVVCVAAGCVVDAHEFEQGARAALDASAVGDDHQAKALAQAALAVYTGDLTPDDLYEEALAGRREELRLRRLDLLDLLAAAAERDGETDEAIRRATEAIAAEPADENRYLFLSDLLVSQGRTGSALAVLRQARIALRAAGLPPGDELAARETGLRGG